MNCTLQEHVLAKCITVILNGVTQVRHVILSLRFYRQIIIACAHRKKAAKSLPKFKEESSKKPQDDADNKVDEKVADCCYYYLYKAESLMVGKWLVTGTCGFQEIRDRSKTKWLRVHYNVQFSSVQISNQLLKDNMQTLMVNPLCGCGKCKN